MTPSPQTRRRPIAAVVVAALMFSAVGAAADPHDPQESGHPLEVVGTLLYPVGWLVETVVFRPLHWLAGQRWVAPVVNHEVHEHGEAELGHGSHEPAPE